MLSMCAGTHADDVKVVGAWKRSQWHKKKKEEQVKWEAEKYVLLGCRMRMHR